MVVDVGNVIELYSEFSRSGATCTPFTLTFKMNYLPA